MLEGRANQEVSGQARRVQQQWADWLAQCSKKVHSLWSGFCQHMQIVPLQPCIQVAQQPTKRGGSLVVWAGPAGKAERHQLSSGGARYFPQLRMP